jgi:hypothetical protein
MTSYLDFLKLLIALGPKLPEVMAHVQHIVSDVQAIVALVSGKEPLFGAAPMELNATEQQAEGEVVAAMAGGDTFAAFDGKLIRALFQFVKDNPELLQLILALLK